MRAYRFLRLLVVSLVLSTGVTRAQVTKDKLDAVGANLQAAQTFFDGLSEEQHQMLSGAALNFFNVVEQWPGLERRALAGHAGSSLRVKLPASNVPVPSAPVPVTNPATDFTYGPASGFTQSETSTALCGSNVVIGFNDSGSYWESGFATNFSHLSFNGFANSTNQGLGYTDQGYLPSNTGNTFDFLEGDPVVACSSSSAFYYSSLLYTVSGSSPLTAVSVSKSTNGGASFGAPMIAVTKNASTHFLDKDWMAVNPANPNQIAVTYTDFDVTFSSCGPGVERIAIELVASFNGGLTWSPPQVIYTACNSAPNYPYVQDSQVAFSPSGAVDVAFELFSSGVPTGRQIEFSQASSLGGAFGPTVAVANVVSVGDGFALQGGFRAFLDIGSMAVDRSPTATNGSIYIAYQDGTDSLAVFGGVGYRNADIMITSSTNNGATWSAPVEVNQNPEPPPSAFDVDSFMPGVAVDNTSGELGVCWYDRRNDPINYMVDRFCATSLDAGNTFTETQITVTNFSPIHGTDDLINPSYMGDYDTVASDTLATTPGFIGAFQFVNTTGFVPNSDVLAMNFN